jgi:hypothetical protein
MENDKRDITQEVPGTSRRDMLKKIGTALVTASVATLAVEQLTPAEAAKLPDSVRPLLQSVPSDKQFAVFYAPSDAGASLIVLDKNDDSAIKATQLKLGGSPAIARVAGGVIQVSLGRAAASRSSARAGETALKLSPASVDFSSNGISR